MPVHRVAKSELSERLAELGKTERVVSVVGVDGEDAVDVTTEPRERRVAPGDVETRS